MSTSIDAPPAAPGPPGPEEPGDGLTWVQRELQRRMAERGPGRGGRHARRDADEPPRGVDHVPRHAIATPGPGAHRPAPIGGPARPAVPGPAVPVSWSWPAAPSEPEPAPEISATVNAHPEIVRAVAEPLPAEPAGEPDEVLGGPSRAGRPAPRAFRRRRVDVRGILEEPPAQFGGPRFHEPDTWEPPEPQEQDTFGGPAFELPAARSVAAADLGLDIAEPTPAAVTVATGPAADVLPPREPARLLAAPPTAPEVETTTRIDPVPAPAVEDYDDDYDDDGDLDPDAGDGVLWSRADSGPTPLVEADRTLVVLSERRTRARPVRNAETLQEASAVGELLRTDLIRSQLGLALRYALAAGLVLGLLPLAFALFPVIGETEVLGFRLPWVLLGVAVYPLLWVLGRLHTRSAERIEQKFADQVQD